MENSLEGLNLKDVKEMIKMSCEEAQKYKDENDFMRGAAFAYRCVWSLLKDLEE